jgi:16S rRNA (guanine966-N2)-methyltransferase
LYETVLPARKLLARSQRREFNQAMRIIAGELKGRKLLAPESEATRPITDRVKQSLFDIISPSIEGAVIFDCFAGTGSMGLECLSRGAAKAVYFESDRSALSLLRKNIAAMKVDDRSIVIPADIFSFFTKPTPIPPANLIFLDPPYRFLRERSEPLRKLAAQLQAHLTSDGTLIFRHDAADELAFSGWDKTNERNYGGMTLEFLKASPSTNS